MLITLAKNIKKEMMEMFLLIMLALYISATDY